MNLSRTCPQAFLPLNVKLRSSHLQVEVGIVQTMLCWTRPLESIWVMQRVESSHGRPPSHAPHRAGEGCRL